VWRSLTEKEEEGHLRGSIVQGKQDRLWREDSAQETGNRFSGQIRRLVEVLKAAIQLIYNIRKHVLPTNLQTDVASIIIHYQPLSMIIIHVYYPLYP
jgi:hypothetical protein